MANTNPSSQLKLVEEWVLKYPEVVEDIESRLCNHCLVRTGERCVAFGKRYVTFWHATRRKASPYFDELGNLRKAFAETDIEPRSNMTQPKKGALTPDRDLALFEEDFTAWLAAHGSTVTNEVTGKPAKHHCWINLNEHKSAIVGLMLQYSREYHEKEEFVSVPVQADYNVPPWLYESAARSMLSYHQGPPWSAEDIAGARRRLELLVTLEAEAGYTKAMMLLGALATKFPDEFDETVKDTL